MATPSFRDFLNDTEVATMHRAQVAKRVTPYRPQEMAETAVSELESLVAERIQASPAESRDVIVSAIFLEHPDLYRRVREETVLSTHGGSLKQIYARAHGSFGVDQAGNRIEKSVLDVEADIMRRAVHVLSKASHGTTLNAATAAVFEVSTDLYAEWRAATFS